MNRSQKHFESLLKLFDAAAKQWGWESDQGWGQVSKKQDSNTRKPRNT